MNKEEARSVIFGTISMALTDPVLQQAFENICNENKELKTVKIPQLERRIASIRGAHSVDCKKLNARTEQVERQKKRIVGLEKEKQALFESNCNVRSKLRTLRNDYEVLDTHHKLLTEENSELKKENDRLTRKCECLTKNNESLIDILNDVERLEKENSELKESNKSYEEIIDHSSTALMKEKLKNYKQLTKAKEIITNLVKFDGVYKNDEEYQCKSELHDKICEEAEQFLKEE